MMLAEPRINGTKADRVSRKFEEFSCERIEAQGFSGVIGDFNEIVDASEKQKGAPFDPNSVAKFWEALDRAGLMDLGSTGPRYTWRGGIHNTYERVFKRLNRIWNKEVFWHILGRKKQLLARLQGVQRAIHTRPHRHLRELEESLLKDLEDILAQEEMLGFQKSQTKWVILGDQNTKYFHTKAVAKHRRIRIETVLDSDGRWITDTVRTRISSRWGPHACAIAWLGSVHLPMETRDGHA
ncbi:hypothetical protein CRG98_001152 [Punica granatum]|uniref:Endonuclease/exonuclease/phosphatase domain-containing protein n=1 Tax=Punica granatum TaxID=22663 RepID=A0A2I0LCN2_PUNGR|nr:hypothetical protein CRG98_001152 [Punica granatum]